MTVDIEDYDHQGRGIGKIDGKVIFIANTIPGEVVEIKTIKEKKNFAEAEVISFQKKSKLRVINPCIYYPNCGGCQLLHLNYESQLKFKENKVKNILERNDLSVPVKEIIKSKQFNYRNKVSLHVENGKLGYYQKRTNSLIKIDSCLLLKENINAKLSSLKPTTNSLVIRSNGIDLTYDNDTNIIHIIDGYKFQVSLDSFFQINNYVSPLLYKQILTYLNPTDEDTILDLYCGTGTIGIYMSKYVNKVIGIEINESAINDAKINATLNNINNIEFICSDASKKLDISVDAIIVDPPRGGLNIDTVNILKEYGSRRIIYVSCDPMTLTRDLKQLEEKYDIKEITPFDMFPNTYHVECVTLLTIKEQD